MRLQSDHLDKVNQTYLEHAYDALSISGGLFITSVKTLVHAAIPDLFSTAASEYAAELNNKLSIKNENNSENDEKKTD
uniref:Uncharacterized protein n=1 Tax=viral metagenome TaxID=1070528 RepID=A0A6C0JIH9_9ZZZZ